MTRPFPRNSLLAAVATTLAAAAVAAGPAQAGPGQLVAAGPDGSAQLAWTQNDGAYTRVHGRTLGADGALGAGQQVSWTLRNAGPSFVGTDAAGAAVIAWTSLDDGIPTVYARRRSPAGELGTTQQLSLTGVPVEDLRLAVEPDGDAVVLWRRSLAGRQVIQARRRAANGSLGPIRTLSYPGADSSSADVAVAPSGAVTAVWLRATADGGFVQTRTLAPDGTLSDYERLCATSPSVSEPGVTVDDAGRAVFGWLRRAADGYAFEARARSATGTLGTTQTIVEPSFATVSVRVAGNGAGRVAFAWAHYRAHNEPIIRGRMRQPDGALGPMFEVSEDRAAQPRVAVDPNGHATFAWTAATVEPHRIQIRRRTAAGAMQPIRDLSDPVVRSGDARVAVDATGKATVAWFSSEGFRFFARSVATSGAMTPIVQLGG